MGFQIQVAATKNDWVELFRQANAYEQLRFYRSMASSLESVTPMRLEDLPNLGVSRNGSLVQDDHYLALPSTERVVPREIRQSNGVIRYALDEMTNSDSFNFWPGGYWKNDCFILGEMASVHKVGLSINLVKKIRYVMRKTFECCDGIYWIGPECQSLCSHYTITTDYRYPI